MKKLSRKEEAELKETDEERYRQYYNILRKRFEESKVNNLKLMTRKRIHPLLLSVIRLRNRINGYCHIVLGDDREKTDRPKIYAVTHICKADIEVVSEALKEHYYLLSGDFENLHDTVDGLFLAINGVIYFNEQDKTDRHEVKRRMVDVLYKGGECYVLPGRDVEFVPQFASIALLQGNYRCGIGIQCFDCTCRYRTIW